jgi:hypothetical protein
LQYITNITSEHNPLGRASSWLARLMQAAGDRLFTAADEEALRHGWQITRTRGGLGRRYRDPRFDSLAACPRCDAGDAIDRELCDSCASTARTTRAAPGRKGGPP